MSVRCAGSAAACGRGPAMRGGAIAAESLPAWEPEGAPARPAAPSLGRGIPTSVFAEGAAPARISSSKPAGIPTAVAAIMFWRAVAPIGFWG